MLLSPALSGPASAFVGCCGPSWAFFPSLWACIELCWLLCLRGLSCISCKLKIKKNIINKTDLWAVFHLCGPASAFVGCWGLHGLYRYNLNKTKNQLLSIYNIKNTKKIKHT